MLAWAKGKGSGDESRQQPPPPPPRTPPSPQQPPPGADAVAEEQQRTLIARAKCETDLTKLRCELEASRLRREEEERAAAPAQRRREVEEAREMAMAERVAREATVRVWREEQAEIRRERQEARRKTQGQGGTLPALLALGVPALLAILVYSLTQGGDRWDVLGLAVLTAAASFAVGALVGFLFGIPRTVGAAKRFGEAESAKEKEERQKREEGSGAGDASTDGKASTEQAVAIAAQYAPNTNLEEVSDWLTKILVGVGLVQIHEISGAIEDLANGLAPGLGAQGFPVAVTLLIAFTITGFAGAYLYTRLRLPSAFELATAKFKEIAQSNAQAVKAETDATVKAQTDALALVQKQLSPGDVDRPPLEELTAALQSATPGIRSQAFYRAREQRRRNWRGRPNAGEDKEYVEPTIGVFRALIACDPEKHYHRSRGELGYSLKDQEVADLAGARAALGEAIEILRPEDQEQFGFYELNRAYCGIRLDLAQRTGAAKAADEVVAAVAADLKTALESRDARAVAATAITKGGDGAGKSAEEKDERRASDDLIRQWIVDNSRHPEVEMLLKLAAPLSR